MPTLPLSEAPWRTVPALQVEDVFGIIAVELFPADLVVAEVVLDVIGLGVRCCQVPRQNAIIVACSNERTRRNDGGFHRKLSLRVLNCTTGIGAESTLGEFAASLPDRAATRFEPLHLLARSSRTKHEAKAKSQRVLLEVILGRCCTALTVECSILLDVADHVVHDLAAKLESRPSN